MLRQFTVLLLLLSACPAHAVTIIIGSSPPPQIQIQIGSAGGTIDVVSFTVPAANVGDGTPIAQSGAAILVRVSARAVPANSRTAQLLANSATPLTNGGSTLPFTSISWTASDVDIPSGMFNSTASQLLVQFQNSRRIFNNHTFSYANTQVLAPGTYTGRVTYTLTMP